jgi:hypothetical protein
MTDQERAKLQEALNAATGKKTPAFGFGKFAGIPLNQVDTGYILWAVKTLEWLDPTFRKVLIEELKRRSVKKRADA